MAGALRQFRNIFTPVKSVVHRNIAMSTRLRVEEAVEEMKKTNPYYDKYASKIAAMKEKTTPEELLARIEANAAALVEPVAAPQVESVKEERNYSELMNPKKKSQVVSEITEKKLSDVMNLELVQDETVAEIKTIWLEYFKQKEAIAAVIPVKQFDLIMERVKSHPVFIFPLPRSQGYEFVMVQFAANTVHFTPLLCYQVHKENAPECLNIVHYTEFRDKGIILMRGEYDSQVINAKEAQCLANELQVYYGQNSRSKLALLEKFTKTPETFDHMEVIKELETLKL